MNEYLISVIDAASRVILISDDHPLGGIIVCIMLYALVRKGPKKS